MSVFRLSGLRAFQFGLIVALCFVAPSLPLHSAGLSTRAEAAVERQVRTRTTPAVKVRPVRVAVNGGRRSGSFKPGTVVQITANTPRRGMEFERWIGPVSDPYSKSTSLLVPATAVSVSAVFVKAGTAVRPVQISVSGGSGSGVFRPGDTITIAADPAPGGMRFARWQGDIATLNNMAAPTTSLVVPATPVRLEAIYEEPPIADVEVIVSGGTGSGRYKPGTVVTLRAYAAPGGQVFDRWSGPGVASPTEPVTALAVSSRATTITAAYRAAAAADVTLTVRGGSGSGNYKPGTTVRLTAAAPPAGKVFTGWIGDVVALAEPSAPKTDYRIGSRAATVEASFGDPVFSLTSHKDGDTLSAHGETIFGMVMSPGNVDSIAVEMKGDRRLIDIDSNGRFAFRVFRETITPGEPNEVSVTAFLQDNSTSTYTYVFQVAAPKDGAMEQILGRLTFGATPALLSDLKARRDANPTGWYRTWVEEQLGVNGKSVAENSFITTLNPKATYIDNGLGQQSPTQKTGRYDAISNAVALRAIPAAYSSLQLREVMTQFWDNHFHTGDEFGRLIYSKTVDFQNYRDNALGTFRKLLDISATSGPMMLFLTNFVNKKGAINENYGREILELHTLGVDSGYTQDDVVAVANILTGRGIRAVCMNKTNVVACNTADEAYRIMNFSYTSADHVANAVTVPFLKKTYGPNTTSTMADSNALLDDLANHPSTKNFICKKIVEYLVSDAKPADFIAKCANAWGTDGDIKAMLAAILLDPSYIANGDLQRTKFKTPYEYAISILRNFAIDPSKYTNTSNGIDAKYTTMAADVKNIWEKADMDFFNFSVPTGFDEQASSVMMTSTLIARIDAATTFIKGANMSTNVFTPVLSGAAPYRSAEAAAAYLLKLAAADRYSRREFDAVKNALLGTDGVFDPDAKTSTGAWAEEVAVRKAVGLILTLPSYQLQ
jgi:uncharacterized protein (DUF1800 family)